MAQGDQDRAAPRPSPRRGARSPGKSCALLRAQLELAETKYFRITHQRSMAIDRLHSARSCLVGLMAAAYDELADKELAQWGATAQSAGLRRELLLTASELPVARLVAKGRTNKEEAASELVREREDGRAPYLEYLYEARRAFPPRARPGARKPFFLSLWEYARGGWLPPAVSSTSWRP